MLQKKYSIIPIIILVAFFVYSVPVWAAALLELRLTGGSGNTDPNASLGGVMSSTEVSDTAMNSIFDHVLASEAVSGDYEYRALDVYNSGDETATGASIYMDTETTSTYTQIDMATEAAAHAAGTDLDDLASESTSAGITTPPTFSHVTMGSSSDLDLPSIPSGQAVRIYLRRIVTAGAEATTLDEGIIGLEW